MFHTIPCKFSKKMISILTTFVFGLFIAGCASTTPTIQLNELPTGSIEAPTFSVTFISNRGNKAWDIFTESTTSTVGFQDTSGENGNDKYYKTPEELMSYYESKRAEYGYQGISLMLQSDEFYSPEENQTLLKLYHLCDKKKIAVYVLKYDGTMPKYRKLTLKN